ncbi:MAG: ABC transporter substrate-binding protein [Vicinamibacterales bacterium]|nr:ABC transporter substrate-binding protein [Vicinamibacterales bacterium]
MNSLRSRAPVRALVMTAFALTMACRAPAGPAPIGFAVAGADPRTHELAQQAIDAWHSTRLVEIHRVTRDNTLADLGASVVDAEHLVRVPGLAGVVGHAGSRGSLMAAPVYAESGVPLVVPTGTSRRLQALGPLVFPLAPDEEAEGEFIVRFATDRLAARRVTVVHRYANEYGIGLCDAVIRALARRGLEPADVIGINPDSDFTRIVGASMARATPDAVIIAAGPAESRLVIRAFRDRLPAVPVVAGDAVVLDRAFADSLGTASAPHVYAVAFWHPDSRREQSRAFVERWMRHPGPPPAGTDAMYSDGLLLLAEAVRAVGADRAAVQQYLAELGRSRPPYEGVTGSISFGPSRSINLVMTRLDKGSAVTVDFR